MRMTKDYQDHRVGLRCYVQFNTYTHTGPMRVAYEDWDDRAGLRGYAQFNKYTHTHTHTQSNIDPPLGGPVRVV